MAHTTDSAQLLRQLDPHQEPTDFTRNDQDHHHDITRDTRLEMLMATAHLELFRPDITPADTTRLLPM